MPRPSLREKILTEGFHVVLEQGFCGASVRDIVRAAGVPQGSFTNHFRSKEAFGLEVLDLYYAMVCENMKKTLLNEELAPFDRLRAWIDLQIRFLKKLKMRTDCLIGNYSIEVVDQSETIRKRLVNVFADIHNAVASCRKTGAR